MSWSVCSLPYANSLSAPCTVRAASLVFFLDYDGTLSPIVSNPDAAFLPSRARNVLRELAASFPTAIVSGRTKHKIESFVQLSSVYYAGSHGFDIAAPKEFQASEHNPERDLMRPMESLTVADQYRPALADIAKRFRCEVVPYYPGAAVEDNLLSISLHYRNCDPACIPCVEAALDSILHSYGGALKKTTGKCVLEVRPNVDWHKGKAVEHLMSVVQATPAVSSQLKCQCAHPHHAWSSEGHQMIIPIYIGDDKTDEDGFRAVRGKGIGIVVADDDECSERATWATYRLRSVEHVVDFLQQFVFTSKSQQSDALEAPLQHSESVDIAV